MVWDDDAHVTHAALRSLHGLWRTWFDLGATQQYYPVLHSAFWLEHRLWGDATLGYHLVNVLLHVTAACLFGVVLRRLWIRGSSDETLARSATRASWLAAFIFALHPVCVESVAWISEQKNTLSLVFYLLAGLAYLRFVAKRVSVSSGSRRWYLVATLLFILALLTKSVTSTLPAALLVVLTWQRGRLDWRRDLPPLLPWFALGAVAGLFTAWVENHLGGANGQDFALSFADRTVLAGRVIVFYGSKLLWPAHLIFIYPHWRIDAGIWWQWLYPVAVASGLLWLWSARLRYPGVLAGTLFFIGSLFPALGFINVFPFVYSYVADHFQYLPCLGVIALAAAGWARWREPAASVAAAVLLGLLGTLTWRQCHQYRDAVTLYETTLARNPACSMAHNNLAKIDFDAGRIPAALAHYHQALSLNPGDPQIHYDLGVVLYDLHRYPEAIAELDQALRLRPRSTDEHYAIGNALAETGRTSEALAHYAEALRLDPGNPDIQVAWGNLLAKTGQYASAVDRFEAALRIHPGNAAVHANLAVALLSLDRPAEAREHFETALRLQPAGAATHYNYGNALVAMGDLSGGVSHLAEAVRIKPDYTDARINLGIAWLKSGHRDEARAQLAEAVRRDPGSASAHLNFGVALASSHRLDEAIREFAEAVRLNPADPGSHADLADALLEIGRMSEARAEYDAASRLHSRPAR